MPEREDGTEPAEDAPEGTETAPEAPEPGDGSLDTGDDSSALARVRREAAGHRTRAREAEAERDALTVQRDTLAAVVLADVLRPTGLSSEAFRAGGHDVSTFIAADGALDLDGLRSAASETAARFGIRRGMVPSAGTGGETGGSGSDWADVLRS